jgi:hypothetical protein
MRALQQTMQMAPLPAVPLMIDPTPTISLIPTNYQSITNYPWNMALSNPPNYWPSFGDIQIYNPSIIQNSSISAYYI